MKVPKSISEIATWHRNAKYPLAVFLIACAALVWVVAVERIPSNLLWLMWLTVVSVAVVALTPIGGDRSSVLHTPAAVVAGTLVTVLTAIVFPLGLLSWAWYVFYTMMTKGEYKILVAEVCCMLEVLLTMLLA
jgi:hypothetical protein